MIVSRTRLALAAATIGTACLFGGCSSGGEVAAPPPGTVQPSASAPAPTPATAPAAPSEPAAQPVDSTEQSPSEPTEPTAVDADSYRPGPDTGTAGSGVYFSSPSGNVACGILNPSGGEDFAGCQAVSSVPSSTGTVCKNFGNSLYMNTIGAEGALSRCTSQGVFFTDPPSKALEYGQTITARGVTCESTTSGIECAQGSSSFVMSRDENVVR